MISYVLPNFRPFWAHNFRADEKTQRRQLRSNNLECKSEEFIAVSTPVYTRLLRVFIRQGGNAWKGETEKKNKRVSMEKTFKKPNR